MFVQIEISTHCNFNCFYCFGRDVAQEYMPLPQFDAIMDRLPPGQHVVCLQGDGEPMLHPQLWIMCDRIRERGHVPYTITNGSRIDAPKVAAYFPRIALSIDTIDAVEAERIGRKRLGEVLKNLDRLLDQMGSDRISIMTVDYGQPLDELKSFVRNKGIKEHMVQPLQIKDDFRRRYPRQEENLVEYSYRCRYLEEPLQRTYSMDGHEFPCCYIKDPTGFVSIEDLQATLARNEVPACCRGCREIVLNAAQPCWYINNAPQHQAWIHGLTQQITADVAQLMGQTVLSPQDLKSIHSEVERIVLGYQPNDDALEFRLTLPARSEASLPHATLHRQLIYRLCPNAKTS